MKSRLTEIAVQKLRPAAGKRLEVSDEGCQGLTLRITEGGKKSWSVHYRVAGRGDGGNRGPLRRMTLGAYPLVDLKAARDRAREALDTADRGDDPAEVRKDDLRAKGERTFEAICGRFVEAHAKTSTVKWRDTERLLNALVLPEWRGRQSTGGNRHRDLGFNLAVAEAVAVWRDRGNEAPKVNVWRDQADNCEPGPFLAFVAEAVVAVMSPEAVARATGMRRPDREKLLQTIEARLRA